MAYRLSLDEEVPAALRAAAAEQLRDAVRLLAEEHGEDPVEAVHGARKDLKKTRALLRLARPGMPRKAARRENRALRDTARSISAARDADVAVETVGKLAERYATDVPAAAVDALRARLAEEAEDAQAKAAASISGEVVHALEAAAARVEAWPVDGCDVGTLGAGAGRAYARGRAAFAAVEDDPTAERLHDWRKRVKDLWYHARLLEEAWPGPLRALGDEAHTLSELLGDDHDLAVLAERLGPDDPLAPLIGRRRGELLDEAMRLGRRLYAEKPKPFRRRLGRYLDAAAHERRAGQPV